MINSSDSTNNRFLTWSRNLKIILSVKTCRNLNLKSNHYNALYRRLILTPSKNIYHRFKCPRNHPLGDLLSCPHSDSVFRFRFKLIWVFSSPILPELQIQFDVEIGKFIKMKKELFRWRRYDFCLDSGSLGNRGREWAGLVELSPRFFWRRVLRKRFSKLNNPFRVYHGSEGSDLAKLSSVTTIDSSTGLIETPHPYESNKLYMFEVPSPSASQSFTFQFTEFEVSIGTLSFFPIK